MDAGAASHPSGGFDFNWSATPTGCAGFTLDHYQITLNESATPTSPTDGLQYPLGTSPAVEILTHRAERTYYARVFACDTSPGCSGYFGLDGSEAIDTGGTADDKASDTTEQEVWLFQDVADATDTDHYVEGDGCGAASAFFFPVTGSSDYTEEDTLVLYCSDGGQIKRMLADATGWASDGYNYPHSHASPAWAAAPSVVAQSIDDTVSPCPDDDCSDYDEVSHPWALPATDGTDYFVRLWAQNEGGNDFKQVVMVDSTDEEGTDFGLGCSGSCTYTCDDTATGDECQWPGVGEVVISAKDDAVTEYLQSALHGRMMWDQLADEATDDGALDVSTTVDEPLLVDSAKINATTCSSVALGTSDPDILVAEWDASSQAFTISTDATTGCADDWAAGDYHDPAVTALPQDEFKMYVVEWDGSSHEIHTFYYDGTGWESDTATPKFELEDGRVISHKCLANPATVARIDGGVPHEGMFISGSISGSYDGATCPSSGDMPKLALYFAVLTN